MSRRSWKWHRRKAYYWLLWYSACLIITLDQHKHLSSSTQDRKASLSRCLSWHNCSRYVSLNNIMTIGGSRLAFIGLIIIVVLWLTFCITNLALYSDFRQNSTNRQESVFTKQHRLDYIRGWQSFSYATLLSSRISYLAFPRFCLDQHLHTKNNTLVHSLKNLSMLSDLLYWL